MSAIICDNISISYGDKPVIQDLSFSVKAGDYLVILGENGAGKSTLIRSILGLHRQVKGSILFEGGLKHKDLAYLPQQNPMQKNFPASVFEIVVSGCLSRSGIRPFYTREEKKIATLSMEKMGIKDLAKTSYRNLSGGQRQRVLLARALSATTEMLFLDEPVTGLDPNVTIEMYEILKDLNNSGVGIVMVSHDPVSALKYASHVLNLSKKGHFYGSVDEFMSSALSKGIFENGGF